MSRLYPTRLDRDFENSESSEKILSAYEKILQEDIKKKMNILDEDDTQNALKTLKAIIGMFKDAGKMKADNNEIYKMAQGMMKSYEKNKGFSKDQANWIYKTSKALFG